MDLAGEAIRLARQLTLATEEPEARGLFALMLLNHARLPARLDPEGRIVTLDRQDRGLWDTREIAEGVRIMQSALAMQTEERRPGRYQVEAALAALHDDAASAEETDWPQTPLPPPRRTRMPRRRATDIGERDHLVRQAARAGRPSHVGNRRLTERPPLAREPSYDPTERVTFGHVRQLDAVAATLLGRLAGSTALLGGAGAVAFVDVDDTVQGESNLCGRAGTADQ